MSFLQGLLEALDGKMEVPKPYGWFHLLWFGISIAAAVVLCVLYRKGKLTNVRRVVLITAVLVTVLEIYKQINFNTSYENGVSFDYGWWAFPWQFCSTPMYVGLLAGLSRGKVHQASCAYLATFSMFAGVCVMFYPTSVFIDTIGINIQTMVCHGSMITIGIYLLYTGYVKAQHRTVLKALPVFAVAVCVAMGLNWLAHNTSLMGDSLINAFYICSQCSPHLPVYSLIQPLLPFPVCVAIYVGAFSLASWLILLVCMGVRKLVLTRSKAVA